MVLYGSWICEIHRKATKFYRFKSVMLSLLEETWISSVLGVTARWNWRCVASCITRIPDFPQVQTSMQGNWDPNRRRLRYNCDLILNKIFNLNIQIGMLFYVTNQPIRISLFVYILRYILRKLHGLCSQS